MRKINFIKKNELDIQETSFATMANRVFPIPKY